MADAGETGVPQSPETQPSEVRQELEQRMTTHDGTTRDSAGTEPGSSSHFGAVDTEVTPIQAPVRGPDEVTGDEEPDDNIIDPADEITPG